uniref:Uncharacterized protein n=1 Tax=Rousettus aegyptiacus TaxID=9407 RepID=A0A7J8HRA1_ROUAE|nr:hypothetical protein HJG63_011024 [Rousettus aegyptiacus]
MGSLHMRMFSLHPPCRAGWKCWKVNALGVTLNQLHELILRHGPQCLGGSPGGLRQGRRVCKNKCEYAEDQLQLLGPQSFVEGWVQVSALLQMAEATGSEEGEVLRGMGGPSRQMDNQGFN